MQPFHISYILSRRQRLRGEVPQWLPAIAGALGFTTGAIFLVTCVWRWFFPLLFLPLVMYRSLVALAFDLAFRGGRPVELRVGESEMEVRTPGDSKTLPLDGVFQVFRESDAWTVLHLNGTILTIPAGAITAEQVEYLRSFAHRATASLRTGTET